VKKEEESLIEPDAKQAHLVLALRRKQLKREVAVILSCFVHLIESVKKKNKLL
jgi:hypothetical protein